MAIAMCRECGKQVSTEAKACPHCGAAAPAKKKAGGGVGKWLLIVFAIGLVAMILPKKDKVAASSAPPKAQVAPVADTKKVEAKAAEKTDGATKEPQSAALDGLKAAVAEMEKRSDKFVEEKRKSWDAETKKDAKLLRACLEEQVCYANNYPRLLNGKDRFFAFDILGEPASEQSIGGREIYYFNVPLADGRKRAKLQLSFSGSLVDTVNVY